MPDGIDLPIPRSIDKTQLVIYYDQRPPRQGPSVQIDKFTLISEGNGADNAGPRALEATQTVGEVAVSVDESTIEPTAPSPPEPSPLEPSATQQYAAAVQAKLLVATDNIHELRSVLDQRLDSPGNPFSDRVERKTIMSPDGSRVTITTQTSAKLWGLLGVGDTPRVSVVATPVRAPVLDPAARKGPKRIEHDDEDKIAPSDPRVGDSQATAAFRDLMDRVNTMTFSSVASQAAFLEAEMKKAGIRFDEEVGGPGEPTAVRVDPLGMEAHLRSVGVTDEDLIQQVLEDANNAVRTFEACIRECQTELGGLDPKTDDYTDTLNAQLKSWDDEFKRRLSVDPSGDSAAAWSALEVVGGVASVLPPEAASSRQHSISPTGLLIRAGIGNVKADRRGAALPYGDFQPGQEFRATPVVPMLAEGAWQTRA